MWVQGLVLVLIVVKVFLGEECLAACHQCNGGLEGFSSPQKEGRAPCSTLLSVLAGVGAGVDCSVGFSGGEVPWLFLRHAHMAAVLGIFSAVERQRRLFCGCCSAGAAMREVMALLDAHVQGCTPGVFPAIKAQQWLFAAAAAPVLPCVRWRLSLTRVRKKAALGISQGTKAQWLLQRRCCRA